MISIHALREEGDVFFFVRPLANPLISIHALREEGDQLKLLYQLYTEKFLSTPSARRATGRACCFQPVSSYFYPRPPRGGRLQQIQPRLLLMQISIHALREEGDMAEPDLEAVLLHFYPRPPRGGRHVVPCCMDMIFAFLSTPSARRATH